MNGEKIRTGILGCGTAARIHAKALRDCPERQFLGAYSPDTGGLAEFAEEFGVTAFASREELLEACECIHICTPSGLHFKDSAECLAKGRHVICEKPMCMTTEECDRLLEILKRSSGRFMPIAQSRYSDSYLKVRKALENEELGTLLGVNVEVMYYRSPEYYSSSTWRGSKKDDGGILLNQAIHYIDIVTGLLGKPVSVTAETANKFHQMEAPDTVSALVEFDSGVTAVMMLSTAAAPGHPGSYSLFGTGGSIRVEENKITKWVLAAEKKEGQPDEKQSNGKSGEDRKSAGFRNPGEINLDLHPRQFREFSGVIRQGLPQSYSAEDAMEAIRLIDEIFRSAAEGKKRNLSV